MDRAQRERRKATLRFARRGISFGVKPLVPPRRFWLRCLAGFTVLGCGIALLLLASVVFFQYRSYARLVDERLAAGYITSRAGIYAAPRVLVPGAYMTPERLVECLRQADYVSDEMSNIWNGSFTIDAESVRIKPHHADLPERAGEGFREVRINFAGGRIASIMGDDRVLKSYALEPELLTKNARLKTDARLALGFNDLPPHLVRAILAIEDRRFFEHDGVDVRGVARALWNNFNAHHSASDESHTPYRQQGGSTITQQLVKNTYLSPERTWRRKFAEAMIATALERRLSKEEVFALYCNEIHLGARGGIIVRGVGQAAQIFFGKEVQQLTLAEAATIAGMIQSPRTFAPDARPDAARTRRNVVLAAMVQEGLISPAEAHAARAGEVAVAPLNPAATPRAPYFLDYVNRVADRELTGRGEDAPPRIYTTLDSDLQSLAEASLARGLDRLEQKGGRRSSSALSSSALAPPQGALVAIDPRDGRILAMVGGRDYRASQLNRATDARRQPGSVFKPFVYAAALEAGISPLSIYRDEAREFTYANGARYRPANYGGAYSQRDVTMREALVRSLNVVAVDVALRTGLGRVSDTARRFGLPISGTTYPSLALGASEATPLELAAAYTAFANGGRLVRPIVINRFTNTTGTAHSAQMQLTGEQVIRPTTAYMITDMMRAVIERGTGRAARGQIPGTAIAGKTGTSRDGWFIGYTPNLVCAVFVGNDDNGDLGLTGGDSALPIWTEFMRAAIELRPELGGANFARPAGITTVEIDRESGMLATDACPHREQVALAATTAFACYKHAAPIATPSDDAFPTETLTAVTPPTAAAVSAPPLSSPVASRPSPVATEKIVSRPTPQSAAAFVETVPAKPTASARTRDGRTTLVNDFRHATFNVASAAVRQ